MARRSRRLRAQLAAASSELGELRAALAELTQNLHERPHDGHCPGLADELVVLLLPARAEALLHRVELATEPAASSFSVPIEP